MRIVCAAVGRARRGPEAELTARYLDRARASGRALGLRGVELIEIDESRESQSAARRAGEAAALLDRVPPGAALVALDEGGRNLASADFARRLAAWRDEGRPAAAFLLGGPDGHGPRVVEAADLVLGFGAMTWPHLLARAMLSEQIYRAVTLLAGHPYHRA